MSFNRHVKGKPYTNSRLQNLLRVMKVFKEGVYKFGEYFYICIFFFHCLHLSIHHLNFLTSLKSTQLNTLLLQTSAFCHNSVSTFALSLQSVILLHLNDPLQVTPKLKDKNHSPTFQCSHQSHARKTFTLIRLESLNASVRKYEASSPFSVCVICGLSCLDPGLHNLLV